MQNTMARENFNFRLSSIREIYDCR